MSCNCQFADLDARDSDLDQLPDAPNASRGNVTMLMAVLPLAAFVVVVLTVIAWRFL